jgi:hypothetical protein
MIKEAIDKLGHPTFRVYAVSVTRAPRPISKLTAAPLEPEDTTPAIRIIAAPKNTAPLPLMFVKARSHDMGERSPNEKAGLIIWKLIDMATTAAVAA